MPPPAPLPTEVEDRDLTQVFGSNQLDPVGVTLEPNTGEVFLLDSQLGLYRLEADDTLTQIADGSTLYQVRPDSPFTDVAALGDGKFAITAMNDGFLFDSRDGSMTQHFCYVPGTIIIGPTPPTQLTRSVTFDLVSGRIVAQPVTVDPQQLFSTNSEVGTFAITGGEGDDWHQIPDPDFLAGGIACDPTGLLWMGRGEELFSYDLSTDVMSLHSSLTKFGISDVTGMAIGQGRMFVLDGPSKRLVTIPLSIVGIN